MQYKPDILIVQECENKIDKILANSSIQPTCYQWFGDRAKGLGVFTFNNLTFSQTKDYDHSIRHCFPIRIEQKQNLNIFAVWAMNHKNPKLSYCSQVYFALKKYKHYLSEENSIFIGDLNSNVIWDKTPRLANFSTVISEFEKLGMESLYHHYSGDEFGEEKKSTFYMYRNQTKGYHIDYCFLTSQLISKVDNFTIGDFDYWKDFSDHCPMIINLDL